MGVTGVFLLLCLIPLLAQTARAFDARTTGALLFAGLAAGGLCFTAFFLLVFPQQPLTAVALGAGSMLSLLGPVQAVSFLVANLILRPWETAVEQAPALSVPKALALIAAVSYLLAVLRGSSSALRWNSMFGLFSALVGWFCLSTLFSQTPAESLRYLLEQFVPVAVTVFLIANSFTRSEDVAAFRAVLLIASCGILSGALLQTIGQEGGEDVTRLHTLGLWGNANDLGAIIAFVFPFAVFLRPRRGGRLLQGAMKSAALTLLAVALWYTQSRGTVLALVAGIGVYFICCSRSLLSWLAALIVGVVLPVAFFVNLTRNADELETSATSRRNLAVAGVRMAAANPLFGVGIDNYPKLYEMYTPSFEEWGQRNAHSSWILTLAETGFPGLALFALLFLWALRTAWRLRRERPELLMSVVSYGVAMSFLSHTYNLLPYLSTAVVLVVARTAGAQAEPQEARAEAPQTVLQAGFV